MKNRKRRTAERNFGGHSRVDHVKEFGGCPPNPGWQVPGINRANRKKMTMRYVLLWALGVPITGIIVLRLLGVI